MKFSKLLFLFMLVVPAVVNAAKTLTEQDVMQLLEKADMAAIEKNVGLMAETSSDSAVFVYHVSLDGESKSSRATKAEYIKSLRKGWSKYESYEYIRNNTEIKLDDDKRATVNMEVTEYITIEGQYIRAVSNETVTIEIVKGKPLITKVVGYVKLEFLTMA